MGNIFNKKKFSKSKKNDKKIKKELTEADYEFILKRYGMSRSEAKEFYIRMTSEDRDYRFFNL